MAKGFKLNFALFWIFGSFFVFFNFTGARRNGSVSQKLSPPHICKINCTKWATDLIAHSIF